MSSQPNVTDNAPATGTLQNYNSGNSGNNGNSSGSTATNTSATTKNFSRTPTSWDAQDDILLMHLKDQQKLGWKEIASHFTNRTPNACQFRWRRLKSGNLKNPPKSAAVLGTPTNNLAKLANTVKKTKKMNNGNNPGVSSNKFDLNTGSPGFPSAYSPITTATFTGYNNNVSNALAGLNALSNSPSNISSPVQNYHISSNTNPSTPGLSSPNVNSQPQSISRNNFDNSPKSSEVSLDPQSHHNSAPNSGGGYYADISIDPTMNLPHNQPHPHTAGQGSLTPRNSTSNASSNNSSNSNNNSNQAHNVHNNSIIQIVRDERNSITSTRVSVSSLPSKSMNIPHHQSNNSALAHLPILFGGGNSISGPSRNSSISGPPGISHPSANISSLRNGSAGNTSGYYSRSGSVVIPYNSDKKEEEQLKVENKKTDSSPSKTNKQQPKSTKSNSSTPNPQPIFKIPWSMEEDELLINRRNRELSFAELSILLPQRTEGEIWSRIDYLERLRNGHRSSTSRDHRRIRQSSIGLDDVDDFYDDVDDVIGGIDVSDDEEDEEEDVLVDDDDSIPGSRKKRKRRTSSAVNPLSVTESIRRRLR